ncbi:hypothetical protein A3C37_00905 [Candidatus Peribacteria bacterium RIFCSPHIGHO2_02_FULL_53_20]|nr:MAG: hypothetical protein A3C37_00905 [Candidatus Peribacteria bacterium RIFCSPHIGHO2_02_FULL_53_20]OGJ71485.1 MAG: hypothetical protein A3G69_02380 [Candidatus Peribacteria bacterium RIFCSPLOWO2_12_FULL_53_10]HLC66526.1 hypothetical protein [Candidatus Nanoarchaeia archaeon]
MKTPFDTRTLRQIGGRDEEHEVSAPLGPMMQKILESTPAFVVANLTIDEQEFGNAMDELIRRDILTSAQYNAIGAELQRQLLTRETQTIIQKVLLNAILQRTQATIAMNIRKMLGSSHVLDQLA